MYIPLIIGAGSKARQGKDFFCSHLQNTYSNIYIVHWADALYEEVRNVAREHLLIEYQTQEKTYKIYNGLRFDYLHEEDVPELHRLFNQRGIKEYAGMDEKDSPILQWWGTNYRRYYYGDDYWVNITLDKIDLITAQCEFNGLDRPTILIPDTRFVNELEAIKGRNGYYVSVERWEWQDDNLVRYYARDRDPNHPSECSLDDVEYDYLISAESGQLELLELAAENIYEEILVRFDKEISELFAEED